MTIVNGYATLTQLKAVSESINAHGTANDSVYEMCIETASRLVDSYCDRRFYTNGTAEVRTYVPSNGSYVNVDDLASSPAIVETSSSADGTYDLTWSASDYQAEPLNRISGGLDSPITRLRAVGSYCFPVACDGQASVRVTGTFGFGTAVPTQVQHATILLALRQAKRYESPTGVQGSSDFGTVYISRKVDPDVAAILAPFRRTVIGVA